MKKRKISVSTIVIYFFLLLGVFLALAPIINTLAISFSSASFAGSGKVTFWPLDFTLESYKKIIGDARFWRSTIVSFQRVFVGTSLSMVLTILMSFPLSRKETQFKYRKVYVWVLVFAMLFNGGMIPTYIIVNKVGLINSFWSLVIPGAVSAGNIILMMNFFKGIPSALEEAAVIDGATPLTVLVKVFLPLAIPSLATITLFTIVTNWNDFFTGLIYINDANKVPLQTYLYSLSVKAERIKDLTPDEIVAMNKVSGLSTNAAKVLVSTIPILIIYPLMQKFLVTGLVLGAVKE